MVMFVSSFLIDVHESAHVNSIDLRHDARSPAFLGLKGISSLPGIAASVNQTITEDMLT
jgi:hypothetical protein